MTTSEEQDTEALVARKRALRGVVLARRDAMTADARHAASLAIVEKICARAEYRSARTVSTYMGFGSEIETAMFFDAIHRDGKITVLPRVDKDTKSLVMHRVTDLGELGQGVWGIREPRADLPPVAVGDIDFLLLPGVAFDRRGNRLGYGAGFYDRLLSQAPASVVRVAGAFDCQLVDDVPVSHYDQRIHALVTETQSFQFP